MNLTTNLLFSLLFLLSVVLQCIFGNFSFEFFAFPLNAVIALLWIVLIWYGYKELRNWVVVRILLSSSATRWTLGWFLAGCLVIGLFPQLSPEDATRKQGPFAMLGCYNFMSSWIFVAGLFSLLTHLGMITVRRYLLSGKKHWRFILNHAGLWLALFAGFVGSASEQTLRLPVFRDKPNNEAFTSQGRTVFLDKPFQLKEFAVEHYANGTPRHFFADIIVDEQVIRLEVNHPYSAGWGEDYYLTSYDILNSVDRGTEKHIMETLEIEEPELADDIRKKMFVFEDILSLDDRAIQRVLRDVDNSDLALALKGANEDVQNVILNNLSKRLAVMIKEDMEFMGPVRMKDVEEAQQKIVNIIRKLEDSAEIVIARGGGDEIIV